MTKEVSKNEGIIKEDILDDVVEAAEETVESVLPEKEEQQIVVGETQKPTFKDKLVRKAMWVRSNGKRILVYGGTILLVCLAAGAVSKKSEDVSEEGNGFDDLTLL